LNSVNRLRLPPEKESGERKKRNSRGVNKAERGKRVYSL